MDCGQLGRGYSVDLRQPGRRAPAGAAPSNGVSLDNSPIPVVVNKPE
jgi:hypothetical protein